MGSIRETCSGLTRLLEAEHPVGRAPGSALRLDRSYVSAQHATLRWSGSHWQVRDLGSRNGTFLDGVRLVPGEEHTLAVGATIAFGKIAEQRWEVIDASAPAVMAVPVDGGEPSVVEGDLLAFPSNDDPQATIYRNSEGTWVLEPQHDAASPIANRQTFEVAGRVWRFSCAEVIRTTSLALSDAEPEVRNLHLSFSVSRDEEHVELRVTSPSVADLGTRTHNYLLLTLARRRLADQAEGLPESSCGWVHLDDLAHDPTMAPPQLNLHVLRIRRQFAAFGSSDPANIIERRPGCRQLRIGTSHITLVRL